MKKVIIVGATSGIGNELAKIFADKNYQVGITGRREQKLHELKATNPEKYQISAFDCTTESNSEKLTELSEKLGGMDILILSSGTGDINEKLKFEIEDRTNQLNVVAFTEIAGWAFNYFTKQGKGHLIVISSIAGLRGSSISPAYNASKAYQINYLEGLIQKAQKTKKPIYVTDIRPGLVDTDMAKGEGLFWVAEKKKAARQIFDAVKQRKTVTHVTKRWKVIAIILSIIPRWLYRRMSI